MLSTLSSPSLAIAPVNVPPQIQQIQQILRKLALVPSDPRVPTNPKDPIFAQLEILITELAAAPPLKEYKISARSLDPNYDEKCSPLTKFFLLSVRNKETHPITALLLNVLEGLDVNKMDMEDRTPFYIACRYGPVETIHLLVKQPKIDINAPNNQNCTPLYAAILATRATVVEFLLKQPLLDLSARTIGIGNKKEEWNPIIAMQKLNWNPQIIQEAKRLQEKQMPFNKLTQPLTNFLQSCSAPTPGKIISPAKTNTEPSLSQVAALLSSPPLRTPLIPHIIQNTQPLPHEPFSTYLPTTHQNTFNLTPFHQRFVTLLKPILEKLQSTEFYWTVELPSDLAHSCQRLCLSPAANASLKIPASIIDSEYTQKNSQSTSGLSKLFLLSCREKNTIILKTLLTHIQDLDVNKADHLARTPLHLAVKSRALNSVEMLLSCPLIDINKSHLSNYSPLYYAVESENNSIISLLLQHPKIDKRARKIMLYSKETLWNPMDWVEKLEDPISKKISYQIKLNKSPKKNSSEPSAATISPPPPLPVAHDLAPIIPPPPNSPKEIKKEIPLPEVSPIPFLSNSNLSNGSSISISSNNQEEEEETGKIKKPLNVDKCSPEFPANLDADLNEESPPSFLLAATTQLRSSLEIVSSLAELENDWQNLEISDDEDDDVWSDEEMDEFLVK